jgi:hypothetical protein
MGWMDGWMDGRKKAGQPRTRQPSLLPVLSSLSHLVPLRHGLHAHHLTRQAARARPPLAARPFIFRGGGGVRGGRASTRSRRVFASSARRAVQPHPGQQGEAGLAEGAPGLDGRPAGDAGEAEAAFFWRGGARMRKDGGGGRAESERAHAPRAARELAHTPRRSLSSLTHLHTCGRSCPRRRPRPPRPPGRCRR